MSPEKAEGSSPFGRWGTSMPSSSMKNPLESEAARPFMEGMGEEFSFCPANPPAPSSMNNTSEPPASSSIVLPSDRISISRPRSRPIFHS